jgi:hypothetical protein
VSLVILSQALMTAFCVILFGTAFGFGMLFTTVSSGRLWSIFRKH